jgi:hypothetical protein
MAHLCAKLDAKGKHEEAIRISEEYYKKYPQDDEEDEN